MPWSKPSPEPLVELRGHLEDLRAALLLEKEQNLKMMERVLSAYDGQLKDKLLERVNAGKMEHDRS